MPIHIAKSKVLISCGSLQTYVEIKTYWLARHPLTSDCDKQKVTIQGFDWDRLNAVG